MRLVLAIGLGSFIGGVVRYLLSLFIQTKIISSFPFGTLTVNIIGCFFIGLVFALTDKGNLTNEWHLTLTTGVIGGFTTFSAFSNETVILLREGHIWYAFIYIIASILVGLLATLTGYSVNKLI